MSDNELKQQIDDLVEQHREQIIDSTREILKFKTVSGAADAEGQELYLKETERCLKYLEDMSQSMGLLWKNYDNKVAFAEIKAGDRFIGLPVHIDVVPAVGQWTHDPFAGEIADGYMWGRGTQDDKGPAIQMFWALNVLNQLAKPLQRGARIIIGTAEEAGDWSDIKYYFSVEPEPEVTIVSDAVFPIINGEKGLVNIKVVGEIPSDLEPTVGGFRFRSAMSGERSNIVPSAAELRFAGDEQSTSATLEKELARFLAKHAGTKAVLDNAPETHEAIIRFEGKSAHGSTPEDGHNAAADMLLFMTESGYVSDDEADAAQFLYECAADYLGGRLDIASTHDFVGPTTSNLGILKWDGNRFEAVFNIRNTKGLSFTDTLQRACKVVSEFADETGFSVTADPLGKTLNAIHVDPNEHPQFIETLKEAYALYTGREPKLSAIGGTTYAKAFPRAVCFGPVDLVEEPEMAHQADERILVESLIRNVKMYAYAVAKLCAA